MLEKRITLLRQKANLTQQELANKLGVHRGTYSNYESGKREPDFEMVQKIAEFFKVPLDYLFGNSNIIERKIYLHKENEIPESDPFLMPLPKEIYSEEILPVGTFVKIDKTVFPAYHARSVNKIVDIIEVHYLKRPLLEEENISVYATSSIFDESGAIDFIYSMRNTPKKEPVQDKTDFNTIEEINKIIKNLGLEEGASGFFDIEKWKQLGPEDIEEIRRHFEWVAHKAKEKKYNPDENDTDGLE